MLKNVHLDMWLAGFVLVSLFSRVASQTRLNSGSLTLTLLNVTPRKSHETTATSPPTYTISMDGTVWFEHGDFEFSANGRHYKASDGSLRLVEQTEASGNDAFGAWRTIELTWQPSNTSQGPHWVTTFRAYPENNRSALSFLQAFPEGASAMLGTAFPSFARAASAQLDFGTLEYTGSSCGWMVGATSGLNVHGGDSKGMLTVSLRDETGEGPPASFVIGPLTEAFTNQACGSSDAIRYGLAPSYTSTPAGYQIETAMVASSKRVISPGRAQPEQASMPPGGINAALSEYGDYVLTYHGKARSGPTVTREVEYLGYSTTGFYFYNLCDCLDESPDAHNRHNCTKSPIPGCHS